jgi:hypothetical protein
MMVDRGARLSTKAFSHTRRNRFAGTDGNVTMKLFGELNGAPTSTDDMPLDNSKDNFERNQHDTFVVSKADLGSVRKVQIGHDSAMDAWHLARVEVTELGPLLGDAKSSLGDAKSSLGDATSSLGDAKSSLGDAKSSLGDAESSLGDAGSSLGDATSSLGDAKSSLGDAKSSLGDA